MLSILRRRILSASIQPWNQLGFSTLNRSFCSSSIEDHDLISINDIKSSNENGNGSSSSRSFCSSSIEDHDLISINDIKSNENGNGSSSSRNQLLTLEEVEKILCDVKADDVKVIPVSEDFHFADYMVIATGRSAWHVRNIAQSLIYKVKQKQKGAKRMVLPSVEGQVGGKWIVIDAGPLIIHALDEKVRGYYNLEKLWTSGANKDTGSEDLGKVFVKVRRTNNSKKPMQARA